MLVNGANVDKEIELGHGDRIVFGNNHMYVLYHPQVRKYDTTVTLSKLYQRMPRERFGRVLYSSRI